MITIECTIDYAPAGAKRNETYHAERYADSQWAIEVDDNNFIVSDPTFRQHFKILKFDPSPSGRPSMGELKAEGLVDHLLGEEDVAPRKVLKPSGKFYRPDLESPRSWPKKDEEATAKAVEMVGDGQDPNVFFVTVGNSFSESDDDIVADGQPKISYSIGMFNSRKEADSVCYGVHLNGNEGPVFARVEDRKGGTVYERYLVAITSYEERRR